MFFFGSRLWQSMLIGGIRYSVKANKPKTKLKSQYLLPSRPWVVTE